MYYEEINPDLRMLVGRDEKILWYGKPDKKCFVLEGIFNPLLPFALIWSLFDGFFLFMVFSDGTQIKNSPGKFGIVFFFLLHLMPVWIYLFGVFTIFARYKNTSYIITDKAIYKSKGIVSKKFERKNFSELSSANINVGIIDRIIGVGDIVLKDTTDSTMPVYVNRKRVDNDFSICDIREYREVYKIINDSQAQASFNSQGSASTSADYDIEYIKSYGKVNNYSEEVMPRIEKNNNLTNLIKAFGILFFLIVLIMFFVSFIAKVRVISKDFSSIHMSFSNKSAKKIAKEKAAVEKIVKQDFEAAENLFVNKIIAEVKNYKLREGVTLDEKIKLLHSDIYDTLKWDAKQIPNDLTYYAINISFFDSSEGYRQDLYRFNYNSVSYMVEATNSETNKLMTIPYQDLVNNNQSQ